MATTDAAPVLAPDPSAAPAGSTGVVRDRVAIGASAGGVQALKELVATLPADYGGTIFVVVHIAARSRSELPGILTRSGPLQAVHAEDGMVPEPGRIYVAPPDQHLLVDARGRLAT